MRKCVRCGVEMKENYDIKVQGGRIWNSNIIR